MGIESGGTERSRRTISKDAGLRFRHIKGAPAAIGDCSRRGPAEVRGRGSVSNREFVMAALELPCKQVQIFFRVLLEKSSASSGARSTRLSLSICLKLCRCAQYPAMHSHIDFRQKNRTLR